jgi:hypothetical protein
MGGVAAVTERRGARVFGAPGVSRASHTHKAAMATLSLLLCHQGVLSRCQAIPGGGVCRGRAAASVCVVCGKASAGLSPNVHTFVHDCILVCLATPGEHVQLCTCSAWLFCPNQPQQPQALDFTQVLRVVVRGARGLLREAVSVQPRRLKGRGVCCLVWASEWASEWACSQQGLTTPVMLVLLVYIYYTCRDLGYSPRV